MQHISTIRTVSRWWHGLAGLAVFLFAGCSGGATGTGCTGAGCVACVVQTDCPGQDSACQTRTCTAGTCGVALVASGTAVATQTQGDCQLSVCNGSGAIVTVADNTDVPADPACNTAKLGVCAAGTSQCTAGTVTCQQNVTAGPETCDGLDNNCDGAIDEGNPGGGATCSTGKLGVCAAGTNQCTAGTVTCQQNVPVGTPCGGSWTWESGGATPSATGVFGTQGTAAVGNTPGARYESASWTDASGNLWLFGGYGGTPGGNTTFFNDFWMYSPTSGLWTWVGGASSANAFGVFGTQGVAAAANVPGARDNAATWTDGTGNLWLFGGYGCFAIPGAGTNSCYSGQLNDLWRYSTSSGQWTWVNGPKVDTWNAISATNGAYGTQGTGAVGNVPGGRYAAASWLDTAGNLWMFGGEAMDASGNSALLNDLWKFTPATGNWTWLAGATSYLGNMKGAYGTQGVAAAGNAPGARYEATTWTDGSGNLWLFGGQGHIASGAVGVLNDLWMYAPATGFWTWVGGTSAINASGVYGTLGTAAAGNQPGSRYGARGWIDDKGNLLLFGGNGYGPSASTAGELNDLWSYAPASGLWTWLSGANALDAAGVYGTLGSPAASNVPGARYFASSWMDLSGQLWLFGGGVGYDGQTGNASQVINDLWRYVP